ncbi:glycosyltransferase family 25 protein [Enterobacter asburiae]|uniref:glycosyltransferase family 25 protein n=1 Tax=Enterobacter asburiae TaxID=61645 RepID=UPI0011D1CEB6|nr:glycosyltransferase family 25 protein [Enterobacter asburiae]
MQTIVETDRYHKNDRAYPFEYCAFSRHSARILNNAALNHMRIFVISLKRSYERRKSIEERLTSLGLEYEIFTAIDGRLLSDSELILFTKKTNYAIEPGEIGCSLSHVSIYAKMVAENTSSALILEDDAILFDDLPTVLHSLAATIDNTPCVTLLTPIDKYIGNPADTISSKYKTHRFIEGTGAYGYVVNLPAAIKLVAFLYPVWLVSDRWQFILENGVCDIQCILPPVISHPPYLDGELHKISTIHESIDLSGMKATIWRTIKKERALPVKIRRMMWLCFVRKFLDIRKFKS